jgi:hypothetical protein
VLASGVGDQQAGHPVKQDQRIVGGAVADREVGMSDLVLYDNQR